MATVSQLKVSVQIPKPSNNVYTFLQYYIMFYFKNKETQKVTQRVKKKKNLPHWQENSKCWAYIPSKTGIIPPYTFCDCFSSPCSNVVFPWHLELSMPQRVVPSYQEFYFHSLNINISCYSKIICRCFTSNNITDDANRIKYQNAGWTQ